jgi:hypothetical protein
MRGFGGTLALVASFLLALLLLQQQLFTPAAPPSAPLHPAALGRFAAATASFTASPQPRPPLCLSASAVLQHGRALQSVLREYKSSGVCQALEDGRYNQWYDLVCEGARFWTPRGGLLPEPQHLAVGLAAAAAREAAAKCKAKRQVAWLRVGDLSFTGNDYIDFVLWRIFFSDPWFVGRGRFLETGAQNGVYASNTLFLERFANFSGLLIEGTPCAQCQVPYNRPGSKVVHSALGAPGGAPTLDVSQFSPYCATNEAHPEGSVCGVEGCAAGAPPWAPVPAAPLVDIAAQHGFLEPDLLSLDVEQFGQTVIATADWGRLRPRVIVAECNTDSSDKSFCSNVLRDKGYTVLPIGELFPFDLLAWRNDPGCNA